MNDPFDVLHQPPEFVPVRSVPDEAFRAAVLAESRRRLTAGAGDDAGDRGSVPSRPTLLEPAPMPGTTITSRRPLVLAAACVVLIAIGVTAMLALNGGNDDAPDPADVGRAGAVESTAPMTVPPTTVPPTTVPPTTVPPTTVPPTTSPTTAAVDETDDVAALLLSADEYGPGWIRLAALPGASAAIDPAVARRVPECDAFVDTVFESAAAAQHADILFNLAYPEAGFTQYSVLFGDPVTARQVFDDVNSSAFAPCSAAYAEEVAGAFCCDGDPWFPSPVHEPMVDAPFDTTGLTLAYRRFEASWTDAGGTVHGPETLLDAVVLHDRALTFIGTLSVASDGTVVQSEADFERIVRAAAARMAEVTGVPAPASSAGSAIDPEALLIGPEAFGDGRTELPATRRNPVEFDPAVVSSQCEPFVDDVYRPMSAAPNAHRTFLDASGELSLHHVTVLPDEGAASDIFGSLTSAGFADCALSQVRMFDALRFGEPVAPIATTTADDIVWYRYERDLTPEVTRSFLAVIVRVGPVVFYLDAMSGLNGDGRVLSDAAFARAVDTAVAAAG